MGKYVINYSCGCTGTIRIFGKLKDSERRIAYLSTKLCPNCYTEQLKKEIELKNIVVIKQSESFGFPQLTGTENQTKWANSIRLEIIKSLDKMRAIIEIDFHELYNLFVKDILSNTSASFWISNRNEYESEHNIISKFESFMKNKQENNEIE